MSKNIFWKDPIHDVIEFDEQDAWMQDLVDTKEVQRLSDIMQLGCSSRIYPSATHTRLVHSLGVYKLAKIFINKLQPDMPIDVRKCFLTACLLHDIGHGPHSHSFEFWMTNAGAEFDHEKMAKEIILSKDSEINKVLVANNVSPESVVKIISKNVDKKYTWLKTLLSSQVDVDRMDYLLRDSHYTGVQYGLIDYDVLLNWTMIVDNQLVFTKRAIQLLEHILIGRNHMYSQVYENKTSYCYDIIAGKIFRRIFDLAKTDYKFVDKYNLLNFLDPWIKGTKIDINKWTEFNDHVIYMILKGMLYEKDKYLVKLANSYFYKNEFIVERVNHSEMKKFQIDENSDDRYYKDEVELRNTIYNTREPIQIFDSQTNKIHPFEHFSSLINGLLKNELSNNNKIYILFRLNDKI